MAQVKKRKTRKVTSEALAFAKAVNAVSRPIKTK